MLPSAAEAVQLARRELAAHAEVDDPVTGTWCSAEIGEAVLVRDLALVPSYWLVPVRMGGAVAGAMRVTAADRVAMIQRFAHPLPSVTGIDAAEAVRRTAVELRPGEVATPPVFVHDGPPGREAWMVKTQHPSAGSRWLFVTSAGLYERSAP